MIAFDSIRRFMPLGVFLGFYALTTIAGNLIYTTPWGHNWPAASITRFSWGNFRVGFGAEYWLLLLLPLIVMPPVAVLTSRIFRPAVSRLEWLAADFSRAGFVAISVLLYGYAVLSLIQADALHLLTAAPDAIVAVKNRFEVLSRLGFWPVMVMQSPLVFLSVYAVVKASREKSRFWIAAATIQSIALTTCLVLLNMKWPAVLFIVTIGFAVLVCARPHSVLKAGAVTAIGAVVYFLISSALLHYEPVDTPVATPAAKPTATIKRPAAPVAPSKIDKTVRTVEAAKDHAPLLLMIAVNRMAMATPYYFDVFSAEGQICGTIGDRLMRRANPCHPSTLVYERMFGEDGFEGTAPAALQISGYALGGWSGAVLSLFVGSVVIGGFLALWPAAKQNDVLAAAFIMGGYTAYFFTQLPFEGPLVYSHGLWWAVLIAGNSIVALAVRRIKFA